MRKKNNVLAQFKRLGLSIVNIRFYTEKQLDKKLTEQRKICCDRMDEWCDYNKITKSGHIVLYAPRP